jgi:hypothetical protein
MCDNAQKVKNLPASLLTDLATFYYAEIIWSMAKLGVFEPRPPLKSRPKRIRSFWERDKIPSPAYVR